MIAQLKGIDSALGFAHRRFTHGFAQVPEERLNWSPGGSAHTPLAIAGRVVRFIGFIGAALGARAMPTPPAGGFAAGPDTRAAALEAIDGAFERLHAALGSLTEADLALTLRAPWGQDMTLAEWAAFVNQVIGYLQGQMNLVQLAYGDEEPHIPPFD